MSLYFFDITGPNSFSDNIGMELANDHEAWSMAVTSTDELIRDLDGDMPDHADIVTTVRNAAGALVLTLRLTGSKSSN